MYKRQLYICLYMVFYEVMAAPVWDVGAVEKDTHLKQGAEMKFLRKLDQIRNEEISAEVGERTMLM